MDGINERVNRDRLKKLGKEMIQKALDKLLNCEELKLSFNTCMENLEIDTEYDDLVIARIRIEFMNKILHSRVNEFMEATKELDLERSYKVTDADQSLRDTLKT